MLERVGRAGEIDVRFAVGPASGGPVVLLHGVARRWQDFLPIVPELSLRYQVYALDFRGHGESAHANAYRVIDYAGDVIAFLSRYLNTPAVVLGHSLGAMVAAAVAAESPENVRALVLEDPPFAMMGTRLGETQYGGLFAAYRALAGTSRSVEEIATALSDVPITPHGRTTAVRLGDMREATALRFTASCLRRMDPEVFTPVLQGRWLDGYDVEATLAKIACPTLFLQADFAAGGALPDDSARELAAKIAHGLHARMAGVGHLIHATCPGAMMRHVSDFLESLD